MFIMQNNITVAQTVNTEQLQHCVPYTHGLFQVCNYKYPA